MKDKEANIKVDGKVRRDIGFPTGVMDVVKIEKTKENFRILYDTKGRFVLKAIKEDEAKFKLCRIVNRSVGPNKIPYIVTHDGRTIRFPNPDISVDDTVKINLEDNKITEIAKFDLGNISFITGGNNIGRLGNITHIEKHPGSFDIVHIRDANGKVFATRKKNVFVVGKGKKSWITLPTGNGLHLSILEEKRAREAHHKK